MYKNEWKNKYVTHKQTTTTELQAPGLKSVNVHLMRISTTIFDIF